MWFSYFSTKTYFVGTQKNHEHPKHMLKLMGKKTIGHLNLILWILSGHTASFKIWVSKVQDLKIVNFHPWDFEADLPQKASNCWIVQILIASLIYVQLIFGQLNI